MASDWNISDEPMSRIKADPEVHAREEYPQETVEDYAAQKRAGTWKETVEELPVGFRDKDNRVIWLAHGFLRYYANQSIGFGMMRMRTRDGTRRDAILYAVGCNATNPERRTNEDKRRAVLMLLEDEEWSKLSP